MKKFYTLLLLLLASVTLLAQVPQKMSYQAIVRDDGGALVIDTEIGIQISIVRESPDGVVEYIERHFPRTNVNGLVTLEIGTGTPINGDFTKIPWSESNFWLKTETDLKGGSNYTLEGNTQLLSVPYAFHSLTTSQKVSNAKDTVYISSSDTIYIGTDTEYVNKLFKILIDAMEEIKSEMN